MVVIDTKSERYETWYTCVNQPCLEKKEEEQVYWQKLPRAKITIFFFFNDPPTTETYPLPLHDALPICGPALYPRQRVEPLGPAYTYRVALEPSQQRWWFSLDTPDRTPDPKVFLTYDYQLIASDPVEIGRAHV